MTTEQSDGACTPCAKGMEMSKCREAFEKQYGEDFNPDHSPVASVWQAAWNARGKVDAEICDRFDFCGNEILIAEAIEAAVLEAHGKQEPVAWMHWYKYYDGTDVVKVAIGHAPTFNDQSPFRSEPLYAAPVVQPDMVMVPREATEAMLDAAMNRYQHVSPEAKARYTQMHRENFRCDYKAMIAAAEGK